MSTNQKVEALKFRVTKLENKMKLLFESTPESVQFRECPSCAEKPGNPTLCPSCLERRKTFFLEEEMQRIRRNFQKAFSDARRYHHDLEEAKVEIRRLQDLLRSECKKLTKCQDQLDHMVIQDVEKSCPSIVCPHCNTPAEIAFPEFESILTKWWCRSCSVCGSHATMRMASSPRIVEVLG